MVFSILREANGEIYINSQTGKEFIKDSLNFQYSILLQAQGYIKMINNFERDKNA